MWNDIAAALALLLVFEGIMPFTNPARWRNVIQAVSTQPDNVLRIMGLLSMLVGVFLLYVIR